MGSANPGDARDKGATGTKTSMLLDSCLPVGEREFKGDVCHQQSVF